MRACFHASVRARISKRRTNLMAPNCHLGCTARHRTGTAPHCSAPHRTAWRQNLRIREAPDASCNVYVEGLTYETCTTSEQLMRVFANGRRNLIYAETKMNKASSRSHAVFQLLVQRRRYPSANRLAGH